MAFLILYLTAAETLLYLSCRDEAGVLCGKQYVAKWNGSTWAELGGLNSLAANNYIVSLCNDAAGNVYAGGEFTNVIGKYYVAKFGNATLGIEESN